MQFTSTSLGWLFTQKGWSGETYPLDQRKSPFPDQSGNNHVGTAASIYELAGMNYTETSYIDNSYSSA